MMLRCPFDAGCLITCEHPGQMAAHLVEAHAVSSSRALAMARDRPVIPAHLESQKSDAQKKKKKPSATTVLNARALQSAPPVRPHVADPASCQLCARLPEKCRRHGGPNHSTSWRGQGTAGRLQVSVRAFKKQLVEEALRETGGNRTHAAERLGVRTAYLFRLIRFLGIDIAPGNGHAEKG